MVELRCRVRSGDIEGRRSISSGSTARAGRGAELVQPAGAVAARLDSNIRTALIHGHQLERSWWRRSEG
jgi:hypothetical protein